MPRLSDLQHDFRRALLDGDTAALVAAIDADGLGVDERLRVYRNNVFASLTNVLENTFPVVCRLVDKRFFAYAASEFVRHCPPARPALAEYGARFPDFLADFPPCRHLAYLPDVARFEWLMNAAAHAVDAEALVPAAFAGVPPVQTPHLIFHPDPSIGLLASPWPIDRIWRVNRAEGDAVETVDLAAGGVQLEVARRGGEVVFRVLDPATFAFRHALHQGTVLAAAAEVALAVDAGFDLAAAFAALLRDGAVTAFALAPAARRMA